MFRIVLGLLLVVSWLVARDGQATVVGCTPHQSGGVVVNHCSNHGYYPRWMDRALPDLAAGLELLRERLVALGEMADLPVLIELPWLADHSSVQLQRQDGCARNLEDSDENPMRLGACYRIALLAPTTDYGRLRGLMVAAATLAHGGSLEVKQGQLAAIDRRGAAARYRGVELPVRFTGAPVGKGRVAQRWQDGRQSLWRFGRYRLPDLGGPIAQGPVWSADGRLVAYASFDEVKIHNVSKGTTQTVSLPADPIKYELLVAFDSSARRLVSVYDRCLFTDYAIWVIDATSGKAAPMAQAPMRPAMSVAQIDGWSQTFATSK